MLLRRLLITAALAVVPAVAVAEGEFIPAPGRSDMVHDPDRNLLYITSGGEVLVFDLAAKQFQSSYVLGGNLRGIDFLPENDWLAVADESSSATEVWIWFVHVGAQTAERITFPKHPGETGTWSVAFSGTAGTVLVTSASDGSAAVPIREFNRSWWTTVELPLVPDAGVGGKTMVAASGDGEVVGWAEGGSADGPYARYVAATGALAETSAGAGTGASNYEIGVNADGSQLAIPTAQGCRMTDSALNVVTTIGTSGGPRPVGVVYHPVEPIVYFPWATTGEVRAYDTLTFGLLANYDAETTFPDSAATAYVGGRMRISGDGSQLFVTVDGGVRYFQLYSSLAADTVTASTIEETPVAVTLAGSIGNGGALSYEVYADCYYEPAVTGTPPNVVFTPCVDAYGESGFQYHVTYGRVTRTENVNVWVEPVNDPPTVGDSTAETMEDEPILYLCLDLWDHYEGDSTVTIVGEPAHGELTGDAFCPTYSPEPNFAGQDSFTFTASDFEYLSREATVTISVIAVNDPPLALAQSASTPEDLPIALTLTGQDVEGSPLGFAIASAPAHGALSGSAPNLVYHPVPGFSGVDSFFFTVSDGQRTSAPAEVGITVTPVNDPPTANGSSLATPEDTALAIVLTGADAEVSVLSYAVVGSPSNGTLSGTAPNLSYTPAANFWGSDEFTFTVSDGEATSATATVSISVNPVNDAPNAVNDAATTKRNTAVTIQVLANDSDVDGGTLTVISTTAPTRGGTVTILSGGTSVRFTPRSTFTGLDTFTYTVSDGQGGTRSATVSVSVTKK